MLARLRELAALVLDFVEQADVLDRDHRLVGEGLHQGDLLLGERLHLKPVDGDGPYQLIALEHRNRERSANEVHVARNIVVFGIGLDVGDLNRPPFETGARRYAVPPERNRIPIDLVLVLRSGVEGGDRPQDLTVEAEDVGPFGFTQSYRTLRHAVEHRLQVEGRAADHLEHVGGGGLLLQRFAQLVEQPRVLDGDDALTAKLDSCAKSASVKGLGSLRITINAPMALPSRIRGVATLDLTPVALLGIRKPPGSTVSARRYI